MDLKLKFKFYFHHYFICQFCNDIDPLIFFCIMVMSPCRAENITHQVERVAGEWNCQVCCSVIAQDISEWGLFTETEVMYVYKIFTQNRCMNTTKI